MTSRLFQLVLIQLWLVIAHSLEPEACISTAQSEAEVEQVEQSEASGIDVRLLQTRGNSATAVKRTAMSFESDGNVRGPTATSSCSAHPNCAAVGLTGDCCPNEAGTALGCCDPATTASATDAKLGMASVSPGSCSLFPNCAAAGLEGNCCPNDAGISLGCCSETLEAAPVALLPPAEKPGPLMTFHLYRVQDNVNYALNGVNMANLDGDLWYLHNEVVQHCPRKFNISRLLRFKVTMRATRELFGQGKNFDTFVAFDKAKCTVPMCHQLHWERYGYVIGCQPNDKALVAVPGQPAWFSLPGTCPSRFFNEKDATCVESEPGGECGSADVTGSKSCTYHIEQAGEISLDDLSGIKNYNDVCQTTGLKEYDIFTDKGNGTSFWDGKLDDAKGKARWQKILDLFAKKYPAEPSFLQDPLCDA